MEIILNAVELTDIAKKAAMDYMRHPSYSGEIEVMLLGLKCVAEYYYEEAILEDDVDDFGISEIRSGVEDVYVSFKESDERSASFCAQLWMISQNLQKAF